MSAATRVPSFLSTAPAAVYGKGFADPCAGAEDDVENESQLAVWLRPHHRAFSAPFGDDPPDVGELVDIQNFDLCFLGGSVIWTGFARIAS
ncbi:hypothetical protein [Mycetocola miduiensis]|uniref:Uncharacterized protein n=1 Tax=Mycetocola miduiensis TaxID=995034 RepID=A0A1I4ZJC0_9MICO|nr:hypothetical protein [Mycetocola miduiensis]SFN50079.1 hypothetical protein SAMN05216219_0843 [Mycetocola miduiensis]